jgi:isopentenyl diphosphate isomerase/L-lactate dehydrogenase-like FMN-dependent dehydrogenase
MGRGGGARGQQRGGDENRARRGNAGAVASGAATNLQRVMTEAHSSEVEKVLLYVSDARDRARRAAELLTKDGARESVVQALRTTEAELDQLHRRLTQSTFYALDDDALKLAV